MIDNVSALVGQTLVSVENIQNDELVFMANNGRTFKLYHDQDCCESVSIEDVVGDLNDLVGAPILQSDESSQDDPHADESGTWTFYKFATVKGYVTVRWYGSSNGYYSEHVSFTEVTK